MSQCVYDTEEGEFVDFGTLEDWELRDKQKDARIKEMEAKLAQAVEALREIAGKSDYADDPWGIARATLAELKGGKNE